MAQLTWLVTGCSSGFGEAFVHEILKRGDKVIATSRGASSRLLNLQEAGAAILDLDITSPEPEIFAKLEQAIEIYGEIDVLVNNAGFFKWGLIEESRPEDWLAQFNTNFLGAVKVTRAILPYFRQRMSGKLVVIGSANGWRRGAGSGVYSASKFALEAFVDYLQGETSQFGIKSIIFEPGKLRTPVLALSSESSSLSTDPDYATLAAEIQHGLKEADGMQRVNVKKGVGRMVDVVRGEVMAAGKEMPKRMPLGKDSLATVKERCLDTLRICEEWSEIIESTNWSDEDTDS